MVNHKEFLTLNWLMRYSGSSMQGNGLVHSLGDSLPMTKKHTDTRKYDTPRDTQTERENGEENMKRLGGTGSGFRYKILIPRFMKGIVKSTALSLSDVMVKSVMAKSACCKVKT